MTSNINLLVDKFHSESNYIEKARILKELKESYGLRIVDLSQKTNYKPAYICHLLRLISLPSMVIDGYYSSMISISHLFILSRVKDEDKVLLLYEDILKHNYTVLQLEDRVREIIYSIDQKGNYFNDTKDLETKLKVKYPLSNIKIVQTRIKSKLMIEVKGNLKHSGRLLKEMINKLLNE